MQASLNAVRHQTMLPPGERPAWSALDIDINGKGEVVAVQRTSETDLGHWEERGVLSPADHMPQRGAFSASR